MTYKQQLQKAAEKAASEVEDIDIDILKELFVNGAEWMLSLQRSRQWTPVDPNNLPIYRVLAVSFHDSLIGEKMYGYLKRGRVNPNRIYCQGDEGELNFITHYRTTNMIYETFH